MVESDLIEGESRFQWIKGENKGKVEILAGVEDPEGMDDRFYTFQSGQYVMESNCPGLLRRIRKNSDIDEVALAQWKEKYEQKRKQENKKAEQRVKGHPEEFLGGDDKAGEMKAVEPSSDEDDEAEEEKKEEKKEKEPKKKEEKKGKNKKEEKKEKKSHGDPLKDFLSAQNNMVVDSIRVSLKMPPKELREGLKDSFPNEDVDEAVVEEAVNYILSEDNMESFKESVRQAIYERYGRNRKGEVYRLERSGGEGENGTDNNEED